MRRVGETAARSPEAATDSSDSSSEAPDRARGGKALKNGDWRCQQCENVNWYWREACNRCGKLRPDVEVKAAARREAAHAKREARRAAERAMRRPEEGAGRGYFERQDPSDRNSWDSEGEEFDEFGRKKKREPGGCRGAGGAGGEAGGGRASRGSLSEKQQRALEKLRKRALSGTTAGQQPVLEPAPAAPPPWSAELDARPRSRSPALPAPR
mmetsp:Transcript_155041/g.476239  ORF Transcript_155041/g.476239 Transcript_155041/m.476239 type:complete len:212 (+) Transcript_155041:137-772(+)